MKIQLHSNKTISNKDILKQIDLSYGFIAHEVYDIDNAPIIINPESSLAVKIAQKLDSIIQSLKPVKHSKEEIETIQIINQKLQQMNQSVLKSENTSIDVQINIPSISSKILNKFIDKIPSKFISKQTFPVLFNSISFSNLEACIYPYANIMILGTNTFLNPNKNNVIGLLKESHGTKTTVDFIINHEFGHYFEYQNQLNNPENIEDYLDLFINNLSQLSTPMDSLLPGENTRNVNKDVRDIFKNSSSDDNSATVILTSLSQRTINQIYSLISEEYADITAVLLYRNQLFEEHQFNQDTFLKYIETISDARQIEQMSTRKFFRSHTNPSQINTHDFSTHIDHFTSPALDSLKESSENLPNRALTKEEIHKLSIQYRKIGLARYLFTLSQMNEHNCEFINTVLCVAFDGQKAKLTPNITPQASGELLSFILYDIESIAGSKWVQTFKRNLSIMETSSSIHNQDEKNKIQKQEHIFDIGTRPDKFLFHVHQSIPKLKPEKKPKPI